MGVFGKLAFWKKNDDMGLGDDIGKGFGDLAKEAPLGGDFSPNSQGFGEDWNPSGMGVPGMGQSSFSQQPFEQSSFSQQRPTGQSSYGQQTFGSPAAPSPSFGQQQPSNSWQSIQQPSYSPPSYSSPQQSGSDYINSKSLEVISGKIDALRAAVESMNARLANIERIAGQEEDNRKRRYY